LTKKQKAFDAFLDYIKIHLGAMIDKTDLLEIGAVLGMTILIKNGIDWTEEKIQGIKFGPSWAPLPKEQLKSFLKSKGLGEPISIDIFPAGFEFTSDLNEWMVSYCLAFYIQRHGKEIKGSIISFAKTLLV